MMKVMPSTVIDKIQAYPTPTTVKQLQEFLGLLGYWRVFIPHLAQILCTLNSVCCLFMETSSVLFFHLGGIFLYLADLQNQSLNHFKIITPV